MACSVPAPLDVACANNSCRQFGEEKVETRHGPQVSSAMEDLVGRVLILACLAWHLPPSELISSGEE